MSTLFEEVNETRQGLTLTLNSKDIVQLWINWDPSRARWDPDKICSATVYYEKNNINSEVKLYSKTLPELFSKLQDFLLSL